MSDQFNAIMPKLASRLRMLSSSADMEVLNAARALLQVLANAGLDIHALVERIQRGGGDEKLSAAEVQTIYDRGLCEGSCRWRRARPPQRGDRHRNADGHHRHEQRRPRRQRL